MCIRDRASKRQKTSWVASVMVVGIARFSLGGGALFLTKNPMTFFSRHRILHRHMHPNTAINCLFISSAGVHLTKFSSFLPRFNKKCLEKFYFRRPGGAPAPPAPLGYDYAYNLRLLVTFRSSGAQISSSVKIRLNGRTAPKHRLARAAVRA